jgi:hypothetical protein
LTNEQSDADLERRACDSAAAGLRFPRLRYVVTEGGSGWILERVAMIDAILRSTNDWKAFANFIGRENTLQRTAEEV